MLCQEVIMCLRWPGHCTYAQHPLKQAVLVAADVGWEGSFFNVTSRVSSRLGRNIDRDIQSLFHSQNIQCYCFVKATGILEKRTRCPVTSVPGCTSRCGEWAVRRAPETKSAHSIRRQEGRCKTVGKENTVLVLFLFSSWKSVFIWSFIDCLV